MKGAGEMSESDQDQLTRTNLSIGEWEQERDPAAVAKLDEILSPDLLFRRADKTIAGKREFITGLSKPGPFTKRTSDLAAVDVRGDRALVTVIVSATREDGSTGRYRNIRLFFRRDGHWQLEFWFNDDVTDITGL